MQASNIYIVPPEKIEEGATYNVQAAVVGYEPLSQALRIGTAGMLSSWKPAVVILLRQYGNTLHTPVTLLTL